MIQDPAEQMLMQALQSQQPYNTAEHTRFAYNNVANSDLIRWQLEMEKIRSTIEMNLKGYVWNSGMGKYVQLKQKLMNDTGVDLTIAIVDSYLDKSFILTDLDEEWISRMTKGFADDYTIVLTFKADEWQVDRILRPLIVLKIATIIFATLMRARKGTTLEFLGGTEKVVQNLTPPQENRGMFSGFFKK